MSVFTASLEGKNGIVTGGTSGYGFEIVRKLAEAGANTAVYSVDELARDRHRELDRTRRADVLFETKDIMEDGASERMVQQTVEAFGGLDFVVSNAGFAIRFETDLLELPLDEFVQGLRTQFEVFPIAFASLALCAAREMEKKYAAVEYDSTGHRPDSGAIVVNLSEAVLNNLRDDLIAYAAAKKATQWIMESLAGSLGPRNIRVNAIAPGFANTERPRLFYDRHPEIRADIERRTHLKPAFMHSGSVVPAVLYLLSDNYVTGQTIALDGGYSNNMVRYFQEALTS